MEDILNDRFFKVPSCADYIHDQHGLADLIATDNAEALCTTLENFSLNAENVYLQSGKQKRLIFHDAAHKGACKIISLLVKKGFDINLPNPFHKQHTKPLWYAIKAGHRNAVRQMVELGADVNSLNDCQSSAILVATHCYQPQVLLQLLAMGLDPTQQDMHGVFPLWQAAILGHDDIFKILLAKGANVNQKMVYENNVSPDPLRHTCFEHSTLTWQGGSVLHALNSPEKLEMAQAAIRYGVDLNSCESSNSAKTPLHVAIAKNNMELVNLLLEAGCNVNTSRPLMVALTNNHYRLAERLIRMGAEVNFTQINFTILGLEPHTPLTKACSSGEEGLVKLLLESGADPNLEPEDNEHDWAPIHYALHYPWRMRYHNTGVVSSLIEYGADVFQDLHSRNSQEIPIFLASYLGNQKALVLLVYEGCDTQLQDFLKFHIESPLEIAIKCHQESTARVLLEVMCYFLQEHWLWSFIKHMRHSSSTTSHDNTSGSQNADMDPTLPVGELEVSQIEYSDFKLLEDNTFTRIVLNHVTQPRCLKQICRHVVRSKLRGKILDRYFERYAHAPRMYTLIQKLPLPSSITNYVQYEDMLEDYDL